MRAVTRRAIATSAGAGLVALIVAVLACGEGTTRPPPGSGVDADLCPDATYGGTIQPIFDRYCEQCHRPNVESGGLNLESYDALMAGGLSGASVLPGDCEGSLLYRLSAHQEQPYMPPGSPLPDADLACLCVWINLGAMDD